MALSSEKLSCSFGPFRSFIKKVETDCKELPEANCKLLPEVSLKNLNGISLTL